MVINNVFSTENYFIQDFITFLKFYNIFKNIFTYYIDPTYFM